MAKTRTWALMAILSSPSCWGGGPLDEPVHANQPPLAALRAPVIAPMGRPVSLDATASVDPEGDSLTFVFQFNDGQTALHSPDPAVQHQFEREGVYTVLVRVMDSHGNEASAAQDVAIRSQYPEPPDFCDALRPCVVGDECTDGVCFANGGALE